MKSLLKKEWEKALDNDGRGGKAIALWLLFRRLIMLGLHYIQGRFYFRKASDLGALVFTRRAPRVINKGQLRIGNVVRIWSNIYPSQIFVDQNASLSIGDYSYINGALISVKKEVQIGKNCYLAPMVQIIDSDYFGLGKVAQYSKPEAVVIEENVWLATRCLITKGVRIGKGAVIAVGAVVSEDVAPYTVVAGAPAKVIKHLRAGK